MATEHQASAHAEATDGAVALHINLRRFDVVFFQASLERRQVGKGKGDANLFLDPEPAD